MARALAVPPELFLLDEPLSALDAQLRDSMQIELRPLQQKFGVTTVLVTHDQTEAMMLADRLVVMKQGRVQQNDAPTQVYNQPANAFVAEFIGAANMLHGVVRGPGEIEVRGRRLRTLPTVAQGKAGTVALAPEDHRLWSRGPRTASAAGAAGLRPAVRRWLAGGVRLK